MNVEGIESRIEVLILRMKSINILKYW